jgi:hypothetical protein
MHSNMEGRKLAIIKYLADLKDESILIQLENLLTPPSVDFWDTLSVQEQELIKKGILDLDKGRRIKFDD